MKQGRWNCCMCASFHVCMFVSLCAVSVCACCVTRLAVCACRPNLTLRETNMGVFSHFLDPIITGDHLTRQEKQKDIRGKQRERERLRGNIPRGELEHRGNRRLLGELEFLKGLVSGLHLIQITTKNEGNRRSATPPHKGKQITLSPSCGCQQSRGESPGQGALR